MASEKGRIETENDNHTEKWTAAVSAINGSNDLLRSSQSLALAAIATNTQATLPLKKVIELGICEMADRRERWHKLTIQLQKMPESSVQVPGLCLRGYICAGVSHSEADRWYPAPGVVALNHLYGFRLSPNVVEHAKASGSHHKYAGRSYLANFLYDAGIGRAPYVDKRPNTNRPYGMEAWYQPHMSYVRPDGREFRCRMLLAR